MFIKSGMRLSSHSRNSDTDDGISMAHAPAVSASTGKSQRPPRRLVGFFSSGGGSLNTIRSAS